MAQCRALGSDRGCRVGALGKFVARGELTGCGGNVSLQGKKLAPL